MEIVQKDLQEGLIRDAEKAVGFFAFLTRRISPYSLSLLKGRANYTDRSLEGDVFWCYENLKGLHETNDGGAPPDRTSRLALYNAFQAIRQKGKEDIADYRIRYTDEETKLVAHGTPLKPEPERAVHFTLSLN